MKEPKRTTVRVSWALHQRMRALAQRNKWRIELAWEEAAKAYLAERAAKKEAVQ